MDIYITFFAIRDQSYLYLSNGFSFGRHRAEEDVDLFLQQGSDHLAIAEHLKGYESVGRIFCSLSYASQLRTIAPIIDDRWVLGGPLIAGLLSGDAKISGTTYPGSLESYFGKTTLSSTFDTYFEEFIKIAAVPNVFYNCSIGKGCYWSKCKFCNYRYYDSHTENACKVEMRPNVSAIIKRLQPMEGCKTTKVHLGIPATPPKVLAEILRVKRDKRVNLIVFVRADKDILDVFREYADPSCCQGILFSVGCESLSQTALNILNKGTTVDNTIELTRLILERGGEAALGIMDHYVFADRRIVSECLESLECLKAAVGKYDKTRVMFTNNGVTRWPSKEAIEEFTVNYREEDCIGCKQYIANINELSEVFECNRKISLGLKHSGIPIQGEPFLSLTREV